MGSGARYLLLLVLVSGYSGRGTSGQGRKHTVGIEHGHFTVDDQPFFPIGFYCASCISTA
jgi:ABC-type Fe3+-citrate transport system substrate-binding protein